MILILNNKLRLFLSALFVLCFVTLVIPLQTQAQAPEESQTLSVSPTLFQMNATPGQTWQSEIRVINVNNYDITVYPQVVNFAPQGETGRGDFIPVFENETKGQTLAEWIDIPKEGVFIPRQQTAAIPFIIHAPENAAPGGHYAAILIGTKPMDSTGNSSALKTAQFVTSLFFVRMAGDVIEKGEIREFTTSHSILQTPDVDLTVRFKNIGNVHLQPQGDIKIFNMWDEERGTIPINHQTHFGNVLPNSTRKFDFTWKSEESAFDIGRYKAIVTLGYGEDKKNFVTSTTYFWIVPYKQILFFLVGITAFFWFFTFAVKMYIKRMLLLSGIAPQQLPARLQAVAEASKNPNERNTVLVRRYRTVTAPVRSSLKDFLALLLSTDKTKSRLKQLGSFVFAYRLFFISVLVAMFVICALLLLWHHTHTAARPYEVTIENPGAPLTLSSEAIYYDNLKAQGTSVPSTVLPELATVSLRLVNVSGEVGVAAKLRLSLESSGYVVASVGSDMGRIVEKTVIIFNPNQQAEALVLSKRLRGALLSADVHAVEKELTIYVGTDQN